jgi:hypothetical protein
MAHIEFLASELLNHIFNSLDSVQDTVALASTCHRLHDIYKSSQQLRILWRVAERQYGPLSDVTQLLTHNHSQAPLAKRPVNVSLALLRQIVRAGNVAEAWADIYPFKKWKLDYENRRLLTEAERRRVRRAIYRLWLYGLAFHTPAYPREQRLWPHAVAARAEFVREFGTMELSDMADVHGVMRDVLACNVCPSNGAVARKVRQRYGEEAGRQLIFNVSLRNYAPGQALCGNNTCCFSNERYSAMIVADDLFYSQAASPLTFASIPRSKVKDCHCQHQPAPLSRFASMDAGSEGWGDDLSHDYVIEDMLKLSPAQILYLKTTKPRKAEVYAWLTKSGFGGDWFENYGDTWCESVEGVLMERGVEELDDVLVDGGITVARVEDE